HVIGTRVVQQDGAILAEEFNAMTDSKVGCAAHREARQRARGKLHRDCNSRLQLAVTRQACHAGRQPGDWPTKPFQIKEAVRDELAELTTVIVTDRLPVAHS